MVAKIFFLFSQTTSPAVDGQRVILYARSSAGRGVSIPIESFLPEHLKAAQPCIEAKAAYEQSSKDEDLRAWQQVIAKFYETFNGSVAEVSVEKKRQAFPGGAIRETNWIVLKPATAPPEDFVIFLRCQKFTVSRGGRILAMRFHKRENRQVVCMSTFRGMKYRLWYIAPEGNELRLRTVRPDGIAEGETYKLGTTTKEPAPPATVVASEEAQRIAAAQTAAAKAEKTTNKRTKKKTAGE